MEDPALLETVADLLAAADHLPISQARLDVLQRAAEIADTGQDVPAGFAIRRRLIDDAATCLRYDLYATAFAWCLATARNDPSRFSVSDLLGHYQDVIGKMVNFPDVSREQYEGLFADVVREFKAHGLSLRTVYLGRRSAAIDFGDPDMGAAADREWRKHPRGELASAVEFEAAREIEHQSLLNGDDLAAVRAADAYFDRPGRDRWYDSWVSGLALLPLFRCNRAADAAARYRSAAGAKSMGYVWSRGYHLEYLGLVGDFAEGAREFERQLPAALAQPDPLSRFYCLRPAALLFDRMAAEMPTVKLRMPADVPWRNTSGVYPVANLRDWTRAEAAGIAAGFDARNGNPFYSEWLARTAGG